MIERWLQITCDETEFATGPFRTAREVRAEHNFVRRGKRDLCAGCKKARP